MLFTTKTCPNCPQAKRLLEEAGINYRVMDVEENLDLARELRIRQAPTLVVNGDEPQKYIGVAAIWNFVNANK